MTLAVFGVIWMVFAPPAIGGSTSYAVVSGISMLPHFRGGDLVLLRREPSYHVGEVAGYHNEQLGVVVMHRIIAIEDGHYYLKGDNNDFVDSYHPTKAEIVGAEWLYIPSAGRYLVDLRIPGVAAVVVALLWILSFGPKPASRRRRRRHRHAR